MSTSPLSLRVRELERALDHLSAALRREIVHRARIEDRLDKMMRHGKVTDVDHDKHLARMELGNKGGVPLKSPWVPFAQFGGPDGQDSSSGEFKFHNPIQVGQQMTMICPNGEFRQALIMPFGWYDKAQSPSTSGAEHVITYGKLKITHKKDEYDITLDKADVNIKGDTITAKVDQAVVEIHTNWIRGQYIDARFVASDRVAKIRKKAHYVVCTDDGVFSDVPIVIGPDPDEH